VDDRVHLVRRPHTGDAKRTQTNVAKYVIVSLFFSLGGRVMKMGSIVSSATLTLLLVHAAPALSHHSNSAYEVQKVITITGVVKEFQWSNPHTWLYVIVDDGRGGKVEWACEGRAPGILLRAGWTKSSLKPGDMVTVDMSPAKDGSKTSIIARVTKADGTILGNQPTFQ
jgi:hypothetical protein